MNVGVAPAVKVVVPVTAEQHAVIKAQSGQQYKMVRAQDGKPELVQPTLEVAGDNVIAIRQGDDLLLRYENGTTVIIEDFYSPCADASVCSVELPAKAGQSVVLSGDAGPGAAVGEGGTLVYAHGSKDTLLAMAQSESELTTALNNYSGFSGEVASTVTSASAASTGAAVSSGIGPMGLLGIVGGGVSLAIRGRGSFSAGSTATTPESVVPSTTITGSIVVGPVINGNQLSVSAFQADGTLLAAGGVFDANGNYTLTFKSNYVGAVLIKVIDGGTGSDYMDEATGAGKSLNDPLHAIAYISTAGTTMTVNITPLTDMAARQLGLTNNTISGVSTAVAVTAVNNAVAKFFGLTSGAEQIISLAVIPVVDASGKAQTPNAYGIALASISGAELQQSKSTADVVAILSAGIDLSGTTAAYKVNAQGQAARILLQGGVSNTLQSGVIMVDEAVTLLSHISSQSSQATSRPLSALTDAEITALTPAEVAAQTSITSAHLALLSAAQLTGFGATQVATLIGNQITSLSPLAIAGLSTVAIGSLSKEQIGAMSATQVGSLMPWQVAALSAVAVGGLSAGALLSIDTAQFSALTATQIAELSASQRSILSPVAIDVISAAAGNSTTPPALTTYTVAGVTGVTSSNLGGLNSVLSGGLNAAATDTASEIQAIVNAYNVVQAAAAAGTAPTQAQLQTLGITGITSGNLSAIQAAIAASADNGSGLDTMAELQNLVVIANLVVTAKAEGVTLTTASTNLTTAETALAALLSTASSQTHAVTPAEMSDIQTAQTTVANAKALVVSDTRAANAAVSAANTAATAAAQTAPDLSSVATAVTAGEIALASVLVDNIAPTVSSVVISSATGVSNSTLNSGDITHVTLSLSEAVYVTGLPQLTLIIGSTEVLATYNAALSSSTFMVFDYTVLFADSDSNGIAIKANSLSLNGGSITDLARNAATLTHAGAADNASFMVDTVAPRVVITDNIAGTANGNVTFTYTFSEAVTGFDTSKVTATGGIKGTFTAVSATVYTLLVTPTASSTADIVLTTSTAGVTDTAGNVATAPAIYNQAVDTVAPTVSSVAISATGASGALLNAGDVVTVTATYSEAVTGQPTTAPTLTIGTETGITLTPVTTAGNTRTWTYTITTTGTTDTGNISVVGNLVAGVSDLAGNVATGSTPAATGSFTADTTVPTVTHTSAGYTTATDTLVITGTNFATLLESGETASTDIKARLDWSKLSWDINGDNAATADVSFALGDIASAVVTDGTRLTVVLTPTKGAALEATSGFGTDIGITGIDTLDISAGFARDLAGNAAKTDAVANAALTITTPVAGDAVIDLGASGKLIAPVQVEGKWYYYWDRSGDGTSANSGTLNGGQDTTTISVLNGIFNKDINGVANTVGAGTTETYRYATINGVRLALPTDGLKGADLTAGGGTGFKAGTAYSFAGTLNDPNPNSNATYDDLLAIWDAKNGTGTGTQDAGTPLNWVGEYFTSATPGVSGSHASVHMGFGIVSVSTSDSANTYVALQVL